MTLRPWVPVAPGALAPWAPGPLVFNVLTQINRCFGTEITTFGKLWVLVEKLNFLTQNRADFCENLKFEIYFGFGVFLGFRV